MVLDDKVYDVCVVGGGIAGVAIAEMISRSDHEVILVEKSDTIFSDASREHHGWFHLGSLYSIFWKNHFGATLLNNVKDLIDYYSHIKDMNLRIDKAGKIDTKPTKVSDWFMEKPISYVLACMNDQDFKVGQEKIWSLKLFKAPFLKLGWHFHVKKFIIRHDKYSKYEWTKENMAEAPKQIINVNIREMKRMKLEKPDSKELKFDPNTHVELSGFDRILSASNIAKSLANNFISSKGKLKTNQKVNSVTRVGDLYQVETDQRVYKAKKIIISAGKDFDKISVLGTYFNKFKKVISPLMVFEKPICDKSFVRMTPFVDKTINHLLHVVDKKKYSVVGGGYSLPYNSNEEEKLKVEKELIDNAQATFKKFNSSSKFKIYWGTKTEYIGSSNNRNYQYSIYEYFPDIWCVVPGKFSLGFSAAIETYKLIFGKNPKKSQECIDTKNFDTSQKEVLVEQKHTELYWKLVRERKIN